MRHQPCGQLVLMGHGSAFSFFTVRMHTYSVPLIFLELPPSGWNKGQGLILFLGPEVGCETEQTYVGKEERAPTEGTPGP